MQDGTTSDGHDGMAPEGGIEFLWKYRQDGAPSFTGSCMALYRGHGGWFIQHKADIDPAVYADLERIAAANGTPLGPGEAFGWVPDVVISRVRELP